MRQTTSQTRMDKQTRKGRRAAQKPKTGLVIGVAAVIAATAIGLVLIVANQTGGSLRESDTAFSVPTLVGQPAPSFTATNVDGQPFTVTPGDGRAKVLVFYMGYR